VKTQSTGFETWR